MSLSLLSRFCMFSIRFLEPVLCLHSCWQSLRIERIFSPISLSVRAFLMTSSYWTLVSTACERILEDRMYCSRLIVSFLCSSSRLFRSFLIFASNLFICRSLTYSDQRRAFCRRILSLERSKTVCLSCACDPLISRSCVSRSQILRRTTGLLFSSATVSMLHESLVFALGLLLTSSKFLRELQLSLTALRRDGFCSLELLALLSLEIGFDSFLSLGSEPSQSKLSFDWERLVFTFKLVETLLAILFLSRLFGVLREALGVSTSSLSCFLAALGLSCFTCSTMISIPLRSSSIEVEPLTV